jgi:hypothetical protein
MISTFIVRDENDLRRIMRLRRSAVEVAISQFDSHRNRELEARINRHLGECGCDMSAMFVFASVSLMIAANMLEWWRISPHFAAAVGIELALVIVLSGVGKLLGIAMARWKLSTIIVGLIAELSARIVTANSGDDHGMH